MGTSENKQGAGTHRSSSSRYKGQLLEGPRSKIDKESEVFPPALRDIPHPPCQLYVIGNTKALSEGLAIVGARNATPYGISCAERFSRLAAMRDITIISGGAHGCDAAAHRAALAVKGSTVVFLGGGCDELYPARHRGLFQQVIDEGGAVVSEYPWEFPPLRHTFRERNRLIAGLARATLIVEAGLPSGTFSTADEALAAGKEVLVVPGSINSKTSRGANRLLYQGAMPVVDDESFSDHLFALFGVLKQEQAGSNEERSATTRIPLSPSQKSLLSALCAQPMRTEEVMEVMMLGDSASISRQEIIIDLAYLQKSRLIGRYPDGRLGALT